MSYRRGQKKDVCCDNCNECGHYSRDCLLPKKMRKEQRSQVLEETFKRIFWEVMDENNWKLEDLTAEETKDEQRVSSSIDLVHSVNMKPVKNNLMNQSQMLQCRVNNYLSTKKRKMSFACFKVNQRNICGLALIDTGNLVHSAIVSWDFWESIGSKINSPMDHQVGTADGQSEGLQVVRIGAPWPVYLEGMEECYVQEP